MKVRDQKGSCDFPTAKVYRTAKRFGVKDPELEALVEQVKPACEKDQ